MKIIHSFEELADINKPVHWAMGVFDGIHLGHQTIIASAKNAQKKQGGLTAVLTFDKHPMQIINPAASPPLILPDEEEKNTLLEKKGVDILFSLRFTRETASLSPDDFIENLMKYCPIGSISVGADWEFGKNREGNAEFLQKKSGEKGFPIHIRPHILWNGERISSSRIRQHLMTGELKEANTMLGYRYFVAGTVIHGKELASKMGFSTANIKPDQKQILPCGAYATKTLLNGTCHPSITNIGYRPTVEQNTTQLLLETHLFNWQGNLYGQKIKIEFIDYIRPEKKFTSITQLKKQIEEDVKTAQKIHLEIK